MRIVLGFDLNGVLGPFNPESPCPNAFLQLFRSSRKLQRVCSGRAACYRCVGLAAGQRAMDVSP